MNSMEAYINDIRKVPLLTKEEEILYARESRGGSLTAKEKMITANLRLVVNIAKTRHRVYPNAEIEDMVAEGNIGLMHAVDKFDPERGFRFSTYATNWIMQYIDRAILNKGHTIRIPIYCYRDMWKIKRSVAALSKKTGKSFFQEKEIYDYLVKEEGEDITLPRIKAALFHISQKQISIFDAVEGKEGATYEDIIKSETDELSDKDVSASNKIAVQKSLSVLSKDNREIMMRRFGIGGYEESTLEEISKFFDVTRERIRQRILESIRIIKASPIAQAVLSEIFDGRGQADQPQ